MFSFAPFFLGFTQGEEEQMRTFKTGSVFTTFLSNEVTARVLRLAEDEKRTRSAMVRLLVEKALKERREAECR